MSKNTISHVVIIGAGRMGGDIAMAFARRGWRCDVVESSPSRQAEIKSYWKQEIKRLKWGEADTRMLCHTALEDLDWTGVELVIEAIPEDLVAKHTLLKFVEKLASSHCIIATNTSSLTITEVTGVLSDQRRSIGMHFGLPAHILPAVEVTRGEETSDDTVDMCIQWLEQLNKVPILVQRDVPGQIINRLQQAMYREIYHLIESGVATARDIDRAVRFGFGIKYSVIGPVASRDIHGLAVHLAVAQQVYPTLHNGIQVPKLLTDLVEQGCLGVRSGRGFYEWPQGNLAQRLEKFAFLIEEQISRIGKLGEPMDF